MSSGIENNTVSKLAKEFDTDLANRDQIILEIIEIKRALSAVIKVVEELRVNNITKTTEVR